MNPFARAYLKYYSLCIGACLFNAFAIWLYSYYSKNPGDPDRANYSVPMLILAVLCILPAWVEVQHE